MDDDITGLYKLDNHRGQAIDWQRERDRRRGRIVCYGNGGEPHAPWTMHTEACHVWGSRADPSVYCPLARKPRKNTIQHVWRSACVPNRR